MKKTDIASFDLAMMKEYLAALSLRENVKIESFRAKQIISFIKNGAESFSQMSNLPKKLIELLDLDAYIATPKVERKFVSKIDGTVKYLFRLYDGECIESVFMRYKHGNTLCISSQAGCRMGCAFCASTVSGFCRNLTPSEMTGQIIAAQKDTGERVSNVVMMGIGEPLDNFDNVISFLKLVNSEDSLNIGYRHISLSTCGLCDKILLLAKENLPITLSISLHNPFTSDREKIMPVTKKFSVEELIETCKKYLDVTGRRISFEYTMIDGETDTPRHAHALGKLISGLLCHVNLIPLNSVAGKEYRKSANARIEDFTKILEGYRINVTVRRKLGSDIDASCGQLRASRINEQENV